MIASDALKCDIQKFSLPCLPHLIRFIFLQSVHGENLEIGWSVSPADIMHGTYRILSDYSSNHSCELSMVLTGAAFIHRASIFVLKRTGGMVQIEQKVIV